MFAGDDADAPEAAGNPRVHETLQALGLGVGGVPAVLEDQVERGVGVGCAWHGIRRSELSEASGDPPARRARAQEGEDDSVAGRSRTRVAPQLVAHAADEGVGSVGEKGTGETSENVLPRRLFNDTVFE